MDIEEIREFIENDTTVTLPNIIFETFKSMTLDSVDIFGMMSDQDLTLLIDEIVSRVKQIAKGELAADASVIQEAKDFIQESECAIENFKLSADYIVRIYFVRDIYQDLIKKREEYYKSLLNANRYD